MQVHPAEGDDLEALADEPLARAGDPRADRLGVGRGEARGDRDREPGHERHDAARAGADRQAAGGRLPGSQQLGGERRQAHADDERGLDGTGCGENAEIAP